MLLGIGRYIKGLPLGFGIDGILVLTYIALFMNKFKEKIDWTPAKKDITFLCIIWFAYSLFEIINPKPEAYKLGFQGGVLLLSFTIYSLNTYVY
jgi:hypothetical protein